MGKRANYIVVTHESIILVSDELKVEGSIDTSGVAAEDMKLDSSTKGDLVALLGKARGKLIVETEELAREIRAMDWKGSIEVQFPSPGGKMVRRDLARRGLDPSLVQLARETSAKKVKESFQEWDRLVVQAVSSIEELDRSMANLYGHCREWYALHFPELERIVKNERLYSDVIIASDPRSQEGISEDLELSKERLKKIRRAAEISTGVGLQDGDLEAVREVARSIVHLDERKAKILEYLTVVMSDHAPSLTKVAEAGIGARLIARAGSMRKLALMPSTSVQTLGAEKALFRHITKGAKPPKHGIIFQHPLVRNSPKQIRGKVSSILAGKISLAARADYIKGEDTGEKLRSSLDAMVKNLRKDAG
ncbi:MAG: NOP58 family protein [Theionarchaea archaeon]|nr:NOP58 family protein [Theionarchaea archaeon]